MINRFRWILRKIIRRGSVLRRGGGFPCPISSPKSIAYFSAGGIGDIIMSWPAIQMFKEQYPEARLDIFTPPPVNTIICSVFKGLKVCPASSTNILTGISNRKYDIAISNTIAAYYMTVEFNSSISARYSYGFRYPDEPEKGRLYSKTVPIQKEKHDIDQNCELVSLVTGRKYTPIKDPYVSMQRMHNPHGSAVVIHPGVNKSYTNRMWPLDRYVEIVRRLTSEKFPVKIIFGPSENHLLSYFRQVEGIDCVINPYPEQLIDEIRNAGLFLGNDSGLAHIAAFFNTPGITLFGPANPLRTAPRNPHGLYIWNHIDCAPCHYDPKNCTENLCMKSISVDQVWKEIERLLR